MGPAATNLGAHLSAYGVRGSGWQWLREEDLEDTEVNYGPATGTKIGLATCVGLSVGGPATPLAASASASGDDLCTSPDSLSQPDTYWTAIVERELHDFFDTPVNDGDAPVPESATPIPAACAPSPNPLVGVWEAWRDGLGSDLLRLAKRNEEIGGQLARVRHLYNSVVQHDASASAAAVAAAADKARAIHSAPVNFGDNAQLIVDAVLAKHPSGGPAAMEVFQVLYRGAGKLNPLGVVFTNDDILRAEAAVLVLPRASRGCASAPRCTPPYRHASPVSSFKTGGG